MVERSSGTKFGRKYEGSRECRTSEDDGLQVEIRGGWVEVEASFCNYQ